MNVLDGVFHAVNFVAPAVVVGFLLAMAQLLSVRSVSFRAILRQAIVNSGVSLVVLLAGLLWFGRDGKMATYAVMVLACASCQLFVSRLSGSK